MRLRPWPGVHQSREKGGHRLLPRSHQNDLWLLHRASDYHPELPHRQCGPCGRLHEGRWGAWDGTGGKPGRPYPIAKLHPDSAEALRSQADAGKLGSPMKPAPSSNRTATRPSGPGFLLPMMSIRRSSLPPMPATRIPSRYSGCITAPR